MRVVQIGPYTYIDCNIWLLDGPHPFIVDSGTGARTADIIAEIERELGGRRPEGLILTHSHGDHIGGASAISEHFGIPVYAGEKDAKDIAEAEPENTLAWRLGVDISPLPVKGVPEGFEFDTGDGVFTVIDTPGHTPGGICLFNRDTRELISGDTVFSNGYGRVDFPGGSLPEMINSLLRIDELDITWLYPGHGPRAKEGAMSVKHALMMVGK